MERKRTKNFYYSIYQRKQTQFSWQYKSKDKILMSSKILSHNCNEKARKKIIQLQQRIKKETRFLHSIQNYRIDFILLKDYILDWVFFTVWMKSIMPDHFRYQIKSIFGYFFLGLVGALRPFMLFLHEQLGMTREKNTILFTKEYKISILFQHWTKVIIITYQFNSNWWIKKTFLLG
jgi:hypothetical protein